MTSQDELVGRPWRLARQIDDVEERLQTLALKNYHVFVQSQQCSQVVNSELQTISVHVATVENDLPQLLSSCERLDANVKVAAKSNADIQYILTHYSQLMELLEIPSLIEGCIANDLFEEALDTIQFTKTLLNDEKSNSILNNLLREVQDATQSLRNRIGETLRQDLSLAKCLHLVAYLRRVDSMWTTSVPNEYEASLKQEFLRCRGGWLAQTSQRLATSDPYQYLMQLIDLNRTSWFDLITQYTAIFGNDQSKTDTPLCAWAMKLVVDLSAVVHRELPKIQDFGSIASVMEQMLFFASSLGRVQIDFSPMVLVTFQNHIFDRLATKWSTVVDEFQSSLEAHANAKAYGTVPIMLTSFRPILPATSATEDDMSPPHSLMAFPILAQLTNGFLATFNDLRLCTLLALHYRLSKQLQTSIEQVVMVIANFTKANKLVLVVKEDNSNTSLLLNYQLAKLVSMLKAEWVPYMIRCFDRLFCTQKGLPTALDQDLVTSLLETNGLLVTVSLTSNDNLLDRNHRRQKMIELVLEDEEAEPAVPLGKEDCARASTLTQSPSDEGYIHELIREYFRGHNIQSALEAFELERPQQESPPIELTDTSLGVPTRLEALVVSWNQTEHGVTLAKPKKKKAPAKLRVTPQTIEPELLDLGVPGCTPKPRLSELKSFGFDDLDEIEIPPPQPTQSTIEPLDIKKPLNSKRVTIGEEGCTPKKEYIFYRETPPSFVTESQEAALEIKEKLSLDPLYDVEPEIQRFIELASSDVSKYDIGKRVEGLGANRQVCGVVTEKHGSKLCGTSGPGTIIIDTQ
ncbi:oligomeric Golgi complex subunit 8, partial [Thraustotheca clavata]